ncbi:MAG TPA: sugar phosphate nucleotidyltransferase, partial [Bryobacteraceae bacterium]|nr:sugar phosphate nucleotidyltransferase [Bryobacteraceae bacterium]
GEPFLAHQLRLLHARGVRRAVLCAGHLGEMVRDFAGDGEKFGLELQYSFDGPALRGTAGAIHQALPLLGGAFFVLYGDSYLPIDYARVQRMFEASGKRGLMTVHENRGQWDTSNVEFVNGEILDYSKRELTPRMHYIDYGLGVFRAQAFTGIEAGTVKDLAEIYRDLLRAGQLAGCEIPERFYEIGSLAGIEDLSRRLRGA